VAPSLDGAPQHPALARHRPSPILGNFGRVDGYPERVAASDRIERLCGSGLASKPLREQVLAEIRRGVPFDAHVWLLTDPVTRVGTSPLADVPGLPWSRLPELARHRYLTQVNRWADLMDAGKPVATLRDTTDGDLDRSALWRNVLRELGVVDVASLVFWDRFGCWAWLDLWRCSPSAPFGKRDRDFLEPQVRSITTGLRAAQALTFVDASRPADLAGPAVLVLSPDLRVRDQTSGAAETLFRLNPPDEPIPAIPAAAYNVAAALVAAEAGVPVGPPWARLHLAAGRWVTCRADRMAGSKVGERESDIAVTFEPTAPEERLEVFALSHGLSAREREVLGLLVAGLDSREMAGRLVLSEHTVNDHVKAVLAKTGTRTRQTLLSRAVGTG